MSIFSLIIIIPTLNESKNLQVLLQDLKQQVGVALTILVSDGGSQDDTCAQAEQAGATVLKGAQGRGRQFNLALDYLDQQVSLKEHPRLLLHADSRLPKGQLLARALQQWQAPKIGHFPLKFKHQVAGHERFMQFYEAKSSLNRALTINGDQGLLCSSVVLNRLRPLSEDWGFLEDQRLVEKARSLGVETQTLPGHLQTSARRFEEEGHGARMLLSAMIMSMYLGGHDEFFVRAKDVYRARGAAKKLQLAPFFQIAFELYFKNWKKTYASISCIRDQLWQCFYWIDFRFNLLRANANGEMLGPFLKFYDQWIAPWYLRAWSVYLAWPVCLLFILWGKRQNKNKV
jgi:glycosyltransferase involved in cell wall biosynthesis